MNPIEYLADRVLAPAFVWVTEPIVRRVKRAAVRWLVMPVARRVQACEAALGRRVSALPDPPWWVSPVVMILGVVISVVVTVIGGEHQDGDARRGERGDRVDEGESRGDQVDEDDRREAELEDALKTLEVEYPPAPDRDEAKAAYREKAARTHPDQGGDAQRFIRVKSAWKTVRNRLS
jgi:hypothetical protein